MSIVHIHQKAKAESGYIITGNDAKKLTNYLFYQTKKQIEHAIQENIQRYRKINSKKIDI